MKLNKKGQAITFANAPRLILLFVLIGMVLGAGVIALAAFSDTTGIPGTDAETVLNNSITGSVNLSAQLPTVGTILGVGLILVVVIGVFAFFAVRGV